MLHAGGVPRVNLEGWSFSVRGLVERQLTFNYKEFLELPTVKVLSDFHCVTRWSRLDNLSGGSSHAPHSGTRRGRARSEVRPRLRRGRLDYEHAAEDFLAEDALFAYKHDDRPLETDHGGPVRLVVPRLYAWKSARWVRGVEFRETDRPGFWEEGGYHLHGDPWEEERFYWS